MTETHRLDAGSAMGYVLRFYQAIERQALRIMSDLDTGPLTREADALLFAIAARDFRRAVQHLVALLDETTKQRMQLPLGKFDEAVPDLKDFRDITEHFDEYALGSGRLQGEHHDEPVECCAHELVRRRYARVGTVTSVVESRGVRDRRLRAQRLRLPSPALSR